MYSHAEPAVENPHERAEPPLRRVAPDGLPAEDQVEAEVHAGYEGGEEHEDEGADVVEGL